ncbi:MAG: lamin tail domain-containing protein, partial [Acidimicrobiia bacterium]|nr:lamin tail domain-containing protein [Acidimicrobiia bacterium]
GDSLSVVPDGDLREIRLDGINAPEAGECLADRARERLAELVGDSVSIEASGTDQFGRTLAWIHADGRLVNEVLVAEGLAIATSDGERSDQLVDAETAARSDARGLWHPQACGTAAEVEVTILFTRPDPPGPDSPDDEFVTIVNTSAVPADLSGFVLRDESSRNRLAIPDGTVVAAGASLDVWTGCDPPSGIGWCSTTPIWNNGGDSALLLSPSGNVVAHARYRRP